jgi:hypothetical protein
MKRLYALILAVVVPAYSGADLLFSPGTGAVMVTRGDGVVNFAMGGDTITTTTTTTSTTTTTLPAGNSDTFTDTNGTLLATHNSEWVLMTAEFAAMADCVIQSNTAQTSNDWSYCSTMYDSSSSDISQILVKAYTNANNWKAVCVRGGGGSASNRTGYCARFGSGSGGNWTSVGITKDNGFLDAISSLSYSQASDHTLRIVASGTSPVTLTISVNGSSIGSVQDASSPIASGKPGFYIVGDGDAATTAMDDWQDY